MIDKLTVVVSGRVQGVGFRFALRNEAVQRGICGWARNLPDGKVEACFEGDKSQLDQMAAWCATGPRWAYVASVDCQWSCGEPCYDSFEIIG